MDEDLRQQIKSNLGLRETHDLVDIWREQNTDEWEEETFEIIREILTERLGYVPEMSIPAQLKQIFKRIDDLREKGEYTNALIDCEEAVRLAPKNALAHHYRGIIFDDLKNFDKALTDYREAIRLDPDFEDARENLKSLEDEMGVEENETQEAQSEQDFVPDYHWVPSRDPDRGMIQIDDADTSIDLREQIKNNFEQLETSALVRIWKIHDTNEWTEEAFVILRGILHQRLGSVPKLSVQTELNRIFVRIDGLRESKNYFLAMDECRKAAKLANRDPEVQNYLGLVHRDLGENKEALDCFQKAVRMDPEFKDAMDNLRSIEKGIEKAYKRSAAKDHFDRVIIYAEDEEMAGALQEIDLALPDLPQIAAAYNDYGLALLAVKKFDEAIEIFLEAINLNPHYSGVHGNLRNARVLQENAQNNSKASEMPDVSPGEEDLAQGFEESAFEEKQSEVMDTPKWMYMDKAAQQSNESSEYQTIGLRKGFDSFGGQSEGSGTGSNFFVKLFTGKYRTHDPLYLIMNVIMGFVLSLPLLLIAGSMQKANGIQAFCLFPMILAGLVGVALFVNVILSFFSKKPKDIDDKGGVYF